MYTCKAINHTKIDAMCSLFCLIPVHLRVLMKELLSALLSFERNHIKCDK